MARPDPRISLLKLAEYLVATPVRRRSIIVAQARPPVPVVAQYRRAEAAILSFLRHGAVDLALLEAAVDRLQSRQPKSDWDASDLRRSIEAIRRFMVLVPDLDLGDRIIRMPRRRGGHILAGVDVSVRPTAIVRRRGDEASIGAIKVVFGKSRALPRVEGDYATTIMRTFLEERVVGLPVTVEPNLCQVVDVFSGRIHTAPGAYRRRMAEVYAACAEIADLWPRPDTDGLVAQPVA